MVTPGKRIAQDIDLDAVEQAIRAAEQRTSGEIRVAIARSWFWGDARASAERAFRRMGVSATRARNGVLIFVAPRRRKVAVIGDVGIHAKVAPDFWAAVVERMTADFRRGDRTAGPRRRRGIAGECARDGVSDRHRRRERADRFSDRRIGPIRGNMPLP